VKPRLTEQDFQDAAKFLGVEVAAVKAVAEVESGKRGGFCPDDFPVTLFEGHIFYRYTKGRFAESHPTICYERWTREYYGKTWTDERIRLDMAVKLEREAGLMSASWGVFQIMGFNFAVCGCIHVQQFVNRMCHSEREQGKLFIEYLIQNQLVSALREHRWHDFARRYNGPGYMKNDYAGKLQRAYERNGGKA
jgi:hypothetical protein